MYEQSIEILGLHVEQILLQHDEISQLADFDRADLATAPASAGGPVWLGRLI
jgi:hypothetical protein